MSFPLREKRAQSPGIEKLERKLEQHRADLTHIDGVLRLFQPDRDPAEIRSKRTYVRRGSFARNEVPRGSAWTFSGPLPTASCVSQARSSKRRALTPLMLPCAKRSASKRSRCSAHSGSAWLVEQIGLGRGLRWKLADGVVVRGAAYELELQSACSSSSVITSVVRSCAPEVWPRSELSRSPTNTVIAQNQDVPIIEVGEEACSFLCTSAAPS